MVWGKGTRVKGQGGKVKITNNEFKGVSTLKQRSVQP